jgi:protein-L-isoaspartate(D-aspartate) O-methyltransferase
MGAAHGTILAASSWGERPVAVRLRPPPPRSWEELFHGAGMASFSLSFRDADRALAEAVAGERLARTVGPIYLPERELATHALRVSLASAFDDYLFFDTTTALDSIAIHPVAEPELAHPLHA